MQINSDIQSNLDFSYSDGRMNCSLSGGIWIDRSHELIQKLAEGPAKIPAILSFVCSNQRQL